MTNGEINTAADLIKATQERRRQIATSPKLCSQCIQAPTQPAYIIEDQHDKDGAKFLLCSLRCMALWATARGWKK